ncbi:MAG: hypothetical protein H6678_12665 [Candidatus Delongbacteria bacterium]|nr:hypothetical protein [Candidatus Delongbacteria bacterium]
MNDHQFFSEHLWDWLAEGSGFEHHTRMESLLQDPLCAAEHREAVAIRSSLRSGGDSAPAGFEARLKARLQTVIAAEESSGAAPAGQVVTPPSSFWRRGALLVVSGAAAVMLFAMVGSWNSAQVGTPAPSGIAEAPANPAQPETGVLASRDFESARDSVSTDTTRRAQDLNDLQPVSTTRELPDAAAQQTP